VDDGTGSPSLQREILTEPGRHLRSSSGEQRAPGDLLVTNPEDARPQASMAYC